MARTRSRSPRLSAALDHEARIYLAEGKLNEAEDSILDAIGLISNGHVLTVCLETYREIKNTLATEDDENGDKIDSSQSSHVLNAAKESTIMDPMDWALTLIQDAPENAIYVFNLLAWANSARGQPQHEAEIERISEAMWAKTPQAAKQREEYRKSLLIRPVTADS